MRTRRKTTPETGSARPQTAPSTLRRRQSEIFDAAAKVFSERGYHGASTQDIANVLGIRQASLYYYFSSKEVALELVCMKGVEGFFEAASAVAKQQVSSSEKVRGLVQAHLEPLLHRADYVKTFLNERQYLPRTARKKVGKLSRAYEKVIEKVIAEGVTRGEFRKGLDARLTALALLGMCKSVAAWMGKTDSYSVVEVAEQYAKLLISGISKR